MGDPDSSNCDGTVSNGGIKIDWLMVEAGEAVTEASVLHEATGDASDHLAVTATVDFGEPGSTPPVADDDIVETDPDVPITIPEADLHANDTDVHGDSLNITAIDNAVNGRIHISGIGTVNFMTGRRFSGDGSFQYTVDDGNGGTDTATVTVSIP